MGELGKRIRLIHELTQLGTTEEVAHDGAQGLRIDQLLRCDVIDGRVIQGHTLAYEALRAGESDAALVGKQLSDRANTTATEVIDIVEHPFTLAEFEKIAHRLNDILLAKDAVLDLGIKAELLLDFVTTDAAEVVALGVEEKTLEHATSILDSWRIARAKLAVDILKSLFLTVCGITLQRLHNRVVVLSVDDLDCAVTGTDQIANDCGSQRLVSTCDDRVALTDIC